MNLPRQLYALVFAIVWCLLFGQPIRAQTPEVDAAEVKRLGNHVQYVDGQSHRAGDEYTEVMGPPADDNHKWFISILGKKGCAACARLKADLKRDEHLRALIQVADGDDTHSDNKTTWAHYTYYLADDASQAFRWEKLKITGYPTIIVQPPLNKKYGPPSDVVCQITGYDGDGKKLATAIAASIKAYLAKQSERRQIGYRSELFQASVVRDQGEPPQPPAAEYRVQPVHLQNGWGQIGIDPPWTPAPKVDPTPAPGPDNVLPPIFNFPPLIGPKPDEKKPDEPKPTDIPKVPEISVIVDGTALSSDDNARLQPVIDRLKRERPGLVARIIDFRQAKSYPVKQSELPAIVVTADGEVQEKLTAKLFPIFNAPAATPATTPTAPANITVEAPPFPWQEIMTAVASGGSIPAIAMAAIAVVMWIRGRRRAAGQQVIAPNFPLEQFLPLLKPIIEEIVTKVTAAARGVDAPK